MDRNFMTPLLMVSLLASPSALADGYSTDIELLSPSFSVDSVPGVDSPQFSEAGTWRVGVLGQYQSDPLVLYDAGRELGAIITDRYTAHLGLSYTIARIAAIRVVVPGYMNNGTDTPAYSADGFGAGDLGLGLRFQALKAGPLVLGARADIMAPSGRKDAYMGDDSLRVGGAALAMIDTNRVDLLIDVGAVARQEIETKEDFTLGSELRANAALRFEPVKDRIWLYGGALNRGGFSNFWSSDSAENPVEAIGGLQIKAVDQLMIDLGGGAGVSDGYGTTEQRVFLGITYRFEEKEEPVTVPDVVADEFVIPDVDISEVLEPEQIWGDEELARVVNEQIIIRDPIQFEFNSDRILPESVPTLRFVARLLNGNDRIGHVVIEGHASEEGSFEYNYELSQKRARAVWEQLILAKVHPDRISFKGMGEVVPRDTQGIEDLLTEGDLAENRRVEFNIVHQYGPLDLVPLYNTEIQVPWNGSDYEAAQPPPNQNVNAGIPTEEELNAQPEEEEELNTNLFIDDEDITDEEEDATFDDIGNDAEETPAEDAPAEAPEPAEEGDTSDPSVEQE
jgi:outer membrane protein OmpA-like peptidoglycan-associated protein